MLALFLHQFIVWSIGLFILFAITKNIPPILERYLPFLFQTPENWVDIISLSITFSVFISGIRVIIPMSGMSMNQFDMLIGLILGSFSFTLRTFIGNLIAYVYILFEGSISRGHLLKYEGEFYEIECIKSQFLELKKGPVRILIPMDWCLSRSNEVKKRE